MSPTVGGPSRGDKGTEPGPPKPIWRPWARSVRIVRLLRRDCRGAPHLTPESRLPLVRRSTCVAPNQETRSPDTASGAQPTPCRFPQGNPCATEPRDTPDLGGRESSVV